MEDAVRPAAAIGERLRRGHQDRKSFAIKVERRRPADHLEIVKMTSSVLRGGCLCGWVRYEIDGPLRAPEHCHCRMCRKAHGAAFSTNAVVDAEKLRVVSGSDRLTEYESSPNRRKCFCSRCGSQLFIRRQNRPGIVVVTLGTLDDDPVVRPCRHVFAASKAPWYEIDEALPRFDVYPGFDPTTDPG